MTAFPSDIKNLEDLQLLQGRFFGRVSGFPYPQTDRNEVQGLIRNMKNTDKEMKEMIRMVEICFVITVVAGIVSLMK